MLCVDRGSSVLPGGHTLNGEHELMTHPTFHGKFASGSPGKFVDRGIGSNSTPLGIWFRWQRVPEATISAVCRNSRARPSVPGTSASSGPQECFPGDRFPDPLGHIWYER